MKWTFSRGKLVVGIKIFTACAAVAMILTSLFAESVPKKVFHLTLGILVLISVIRAFRRS